MQAASFSQIANPVCVSIVLAAFWTPPLDQITACYQHVLQI